MSCHHSRNAIQTLTTLWLDFNNVGDEGMKYVADALRINRVR